MFAVSCAALILEVALTRIFSYVLWYHLTYLVISLALLGYGAAGTLLATWSGFAKADYARTVARSCLLFSLLTVLAVIAAVQFPNDPQDLSQGYFRQILPIALLHLTLGLPFFSGGLTIGFILMRNRHDTNRLYGADLIGAGLGSFLAVVIINYTGALTAVFFAASLPAVVACAADWRHRNRARLVSSLIALVLLAATWTSTSHQIVPVKISKSKDYAALQDYTIYTGWNIVSRIDVASPRTEIVQLGGRISETYQGEPHEVLPIYQDGTAPTWIVSVPGRPEDDPMLGYYLQGAPYSFRDHPGSVLVIGVGGGVDALIAQHASARRVVGVEMNPITLGLITRRYRDLAAGLFRDGNLDLVLSEGRHYLTQSHEKFDVIQLSGVDTFAALSSGSFVLAENYLYTSEAIRDLVNHLQDDGVLSYSRWLFTPPRESLKLVVTANEALQRMNIADPNRHIFIVAGGPTRARWADTMIKKNPFTAKEIQGLRDWASARQFDVIYDPTESHSNPFNAYLDATPAKQKKFVQSYLYDVSPSRDDRPFFFQFYRWKNLLHFRAVQGQGGYGLGSMPKGLFTLCQTFVELLVFSVAFVLWPLRRTKSLGLPSRWVGAWLLTFAGLGLGFIAVEMVLIQKLSVFLGGPAYSMSVTLFALLIFSGLGSRLSQRLAHASYSALSSRLVALLAIQAGELIFLNRGLPSLLVLPHVWRCVVGVAAIAPLGLLMGMPFPTLLAKAGESSVTLVPWAWGVNACATVLGSVLTVMISLQLGFNLTWLLAMGMYVVVMLMVAVFLPRVSEVRCPANSA